MKRWLRETWAAFAQLWPRPHRSAPGSWLIPANHQSISATGIIRLTSLFRRSDRHEEDQNRPKRQDKEEGIKMKKFGFATIVASGLAAAVLGLAGPAQADIGHHDWVQDIQQRATVGSVTPTFGNGR
jgi:hypothetical protein